MSRGCTGCYPSGMLDRVRQAGTARWPVFGLFTTIECLPVIVAVHAIQAGIAVMGRARSPGSAGRPSRSERA